MCGIAGIINLAGTESEPTEQQLTTMLAAIRYRGPDESGIYLNSKAGLGHVRLSILDLSGGSQPISARDNRYWIIYNGELFNYPELRRELEKSGIRFTTNTDTEVVLQAYALWGPDCLKQFNGQFAIAIWDNLKDELFLARDRVGIRPLFYTNTGNRFIFCSEIKGIFQIQEVKRAINPKGLAQIFSFWTTITPETPFEDIYEVPPGHYLMVSKKSVSVTRFWNLLYPSANNHLQLSRDEAAEEMRALFRDAVRIRLRADVEVAAYLSGGIDSSVTTAFIHELEPRRLNTFSIGFSDRNFDETSYQLEAARYFDTHHTAFSCTSEEIGRHFYDTVRHTEFPILRTAPTPMYLLSKKVREHNIKVVITGEGADEMLAGYNIFKEAKIRRFWAAAPQSEIRPLLLKKLYPYLPMMKDAKASALKMFFGFKLNDTDSPFYSHLLRWHNTSRIQYYLSDNIAANLSGYNYLDDASRILPADFANWGNLAKSQYLESSIFMSGYLLSSQGDRMAMANSVEGRYPFLDHRVMEFAASLPENYKLNCLNEKYILKRMMKGKIPDSIAARSKQAYRAPVSTSLSGADAPEYAKEMLSRPVLQKFDLFNPEKVEKLVAKINADSSKATEVEGMALAGIISAQLIYQMFIEDGVKVSPGDRPANLRVIRG